MYLICSIFLHFAIGSNKKGLSKSVFFKQHLAFQSSIFKIVLDSLIQGKNNRYYSDKGCGQELLISKCLNR